MGCLVNILLTFHCQFSNVLIHPPGQVFIEEMKRLSESFQRWHWSWLSLGLMDAIDIKHYLDLDHLVLSSSLTPDLCCVHCIP